MSGEFCVRDVPETELVDYRMVDDFIKSLGAAEARGLLEMLCREAEQRLGALRALGHTQRAAIDFEAHTLEGSAGMLGLSRFCTLLRTLRRELPDMGADQYQQALDELGATLTASRAVLESYLRR
jgi:HPt (histidine-containing phosphotransfer) domain-containing protein